MGRFSQALIRISLANKNVVQMGRQRPASSAANSNTTLLPGAQARRFGALFQTHRSTASPLISQSTISLGHLQCVDARVYSFRHRTLIAFTIRVESRVSVVETSHTLTPSKNGRASQDMDGNDNNETLGTGAYRCVFRDSVFTSCSSMAEFLRVSREHEQIKRF